MDPIFPPLPLKQVPQAAQMLIGIQEQERQIVQASEMRDAYVDGLIDILRGQDELSAVRHQGSRGDVVAFLGRDGTALRVMPYGQAVRAGIVRALPSDDEIDESAAFEAFRDSIGIGVGDLMSRPIEPADAAQGGE